MVCVVTPAYLKSVWCAAEIGAARALGTEIAAGAFLVGRRAAHPAQRPSTVVDAALDPSEARERLRSRLSVIDGGGGWGWPDDKSPYPGLRPFDRGEHRVFFGADPRDHPDRRAAAVDDGTGGPSNSHGGGTLRVRKVVVDPRRASAPYRRWRSTGCRSHRSLPGTDPLGGLVRAIAALTRERRIPFDVTSLRNEP